MRRYDHRQTNCCSTHLSSLYMCVCAHVYVILLSLALHAVQPTRSNPVLTTVSWAAVTDVKSHYPNAAISLTRSWVNEFVEMCDPFLIRWFLMHWWERGREMWVCQFSRNGTSSAATCRACCAAKRLCLMVLTPRLDFHGGTFFRGSGSDTWDRLAFLQYLGKQFLHCWCISQSHYGLISLLQGQRACVWIDSWGQNTVTTQWMVTKKLISNQLPTCFSPAPFICFECWAR